jgi:DNA-binding IclR family transcriptional regulator
VSYRVQSLERGIDILQALAAAPKTVTEVAAETGLSKGTAFRLLASLSYKQFVVRESSGSRYVLGPGLLPLMGRTRATFGWIGALGERPLRELWEQTGETVLVHVRIGAQRVCVEELASAHPIRYVATVGAAEPIHIGSAGKMLLACIPEAEFEVLLRKLRLERVTERSPTDPEVLRAQVAEARERGWAMSEGERIAGSGSLSVPVRVPGMTSAALSVLGPVDRVTAARRQEWLPLAQRAAAAIEALLAPGPPSSPRRVAANARRQRAG